jgi:hypothetical protein
LEKTRLEPDALDDVMLLLNVADVPVNGPENIEFPSPAILNFEAPL